jgi:hypothetical protein
MEMKCEFCVENKLEHGPESFFLSLSHRIEQSAEFIGPLGPTALAA